MHNVTPVFHFISTYMYIHVFKLFFNSLHQSWIYRPKLYSVLLQLDTACAKTSNFGVKAHILLLKRKPYPIK